MRTGDGGVHADLPVDQPGSIRVGQQLGQDPVPGAVPSQAPVPLPHRLPRTELRRQVTPGDPGAVPVDDPLDHLPVITKRLALLAIRRRHQRRDQFPLRVGHVPQDKRQAYVDMARKTWPMFQRYGALRMVETWGVDVPEG